MRKYLSWLKDIIRDISFLRIISDSITPSILQELHTDKMNEGCTSMDRVKEVEKENEALKKQIKLLEREKVPQ
jgi:hypothetical protein